MEKEFKDSLNQNLQNIKLDFNLLKKGESFKSTLENNCGNLKISIFKGKLQIVANKFNRCKNTCYGTELSFILRKEDNETHFEARMIPFAKKDLWEKLYDHTRGVLFKIALNFYN